jgi:hypothetical protein
LAYCQEDLQKRKGKHMNKFREWYIRNSNEITWFVIGMCTITGVLALAAGNYVSGIINLGIAYINYLMNNR